MRFAALGTGRLDYIGIYRALGQPLHIFEFGRLLVEHFDEHASDDLAFLLGIALALECLEKTLFCIDTDHAHSHVLRERRHHLIALAQAQQTVIDEHTGELRADGLVQQGCQHRRVDTARKDLTTPYPCPLARGCVPRCPR